MKKLYVVLLIVLLTPVAVYAWNDCPYGLLDDPFPGQCPRYLDSNQNQVCDHSESPSSTIQNNSSTTSPATNTSLNSNLSSDTLEANSPPTESFNLIPLAVTTLILYLISYLLYLESYLQRKVFYTIWKYVLLASFALAGATGLILVVFINYGIHSSWNLTIDFWHAEFAIIMAVSTFLHLHLYWKQVKRIFKK